MPRIGVNIPYSDIYGDKPSISEVFHGFLEFDLKDTFRLLSKLNYVLSEDDELAEAESTKYMFRPETNARVSAFARRTNAKVVPFFRQQVLTAMKILLLTHSLQEGKLPQEDEAARHELGDLLLKVTDFCGPKSALRVSDDLIGEPAALIRDFAISSSLENEPVYGRHLVRYFRLLFDFVPQALSKKGLPEDLWEKYFLASYACELKDVFALAHVIYLHFVSLRQNDYQGVHPWFEREGFFRNFIWDTERIDRTLKHMSSEWDKLSDLFLREQSLPFTADYTVFHSRPLVVDGPGFQVVDRRFLMSMFGEQLLRQVRTAIPIREQQDRFGSVLGEAFELYVRWLLRQVFRPEGGVLVDRLQTPVGGSDKAPDLEVIDTPVHVLIEVKGMLFSDHAVYGSDPQLFGLELYRNYAQSGGVKQLATYIAGLQKQKNNAKPRRVQPVIVGLDRSLSSFAIQSTLHKAFDHYLLVSGGAEDPLDGPMVTRTTVLAAEEFEALVANLIDGARLKDMIDEIVASDSSGMLPAYDAIATSRYKSANVPQFVTDALSEIRQHAALNVFGAEA